MQGVTRPIPADIEIILLATFAEEERFLERFPLSG